MLTLLNEIMYYRLVTDRIDIGTHNEALGDLFELEDIRKVTGFALVAHPELSDLTYFSIDSDPRSSASKYFPI